MAGSKGHKDKGQLSLLKTLLANIPHPAVIVDLESVLVAWNPSFRYACYGNNSDLDSGVQLEKLIDPELAQAIKTTHGSANTTASTEDLKNKHPFRLGRSYNCTLTSIEDSDLLLVVFKENEDRPPHHLNRENYFRQLFFDTPTPIVLTAIDRKIVLANKAYCQLTGYSVEELIKLHTSEISSAEDRDHRSKMYQKVFSDEIEFFEADKTYRHKDGSIIPVRVRRSTIELGDEMYLVGFVLDLKPFIESEKKIAEQNSFLDLIINSNPNFIFAKDLEGRFTLINQKIIDVLGMSRSELLGKTDMEILPNKEEAQKFKDMDLRIMRTRESLIFEEAITDKYDIQQQLRTVKSPIIGANGDVLGIMGVSEIITEQKQIKEALEESQSLNLIGSWDYWPDNKDGQYHFSKQLATLLNLDPNEKHFLRIFLNGVPEPYRSTIKKTFLKCRDEFTSFTIIHPFQQEGKETRWFSNTGRSYKSEEGKVYRLSGAFQDITERVFSEKALRESEKSLNLALRSANLSTFTYNIESKMILVKKDSFHHLPIEGDSADIHLDTAVELLLQEDRPKFKASFEKMLSSPEPTGGVFRVRDLHKNIHYIEILCSTIFDSNDNPTEITGVIQDITDRIEIREKMAQQLQESSRLKWEAEQREYELESKKAANVLLQELNKQIQEKNHAISLQAEYLSENNKALAQERKNLQAAHLQLSLITNNVPVGIAHLDNDLKLLFVNETLLNWFESDSKSLLNENAKVLFGERLYMLKLSHFGELIKGKTISTEWTLSLIGQEKRETRITLVPNIGPYENLEGMILLIEDISSLKEMERSQVRLQESQLKEIEAMSELDGMRKHQLQRELEHKDRELANVALFMGRKNELIVKIKSILEESKLVEEKIKEMRILLQNVESDNQWKEFELRFNNVHSNFYERLRGAHPNLSKNDLRLSAFLVLNMSTKEIADLTLQNPKSLKVARSRLRKKLEIANQKISISEYLLNFTGRIE